MIYNCAMTDAGVAGKTAMVSAAARGIELLRLASVCAIFLLAGCVSVPPGRRAVVMGPTGAMSELGEGEAPIAPLSMTRLYDVREQERNEDLHALTADGAPVTAGSSLVSYRPVAGELVALERETGTDYYAVLVRPILMSEVRRVLARYRWRELVDPGAVLAAQKAITEAAAARLRPRHVALDALVLRGIFLDLPGANAAIADTSVWQQKALQARQDVALARGRADARRQRARGTADAHARVAPTLTADILEDEDRRAWQRLLNSPATVVLASENGDKNLVEVEP